MRNSLNFVPWFLLLTSVSCFNPVKYKVFLEPSLVSAGKDGEIPIRGVALGGEVETDIETSFTFIIRIPKRTFDLKHVYATQNGTNIIRRSSQGRKGDMFRLWLDSGSGTIKIKAGFERPAKDLPEIGYRAYRARGANSSESARSLSVLSFGSGEERFPFPIVSEVNVSKPVDIEMQIQLKQNFTLLVDESNVNVVRSSQESEGSGQLRSLSLRSSLSELLIVVLGPSFSSLSSANVTSLRLWGRQETSASMYFVASRRELLTGALLRLFGAVVVPSARVVDVVAAPVVRPRGGSGPNATLLVVPDSSLMVDTATSGPSAARGALLTVARYALLALLPLPSTPAAFVLFAQYALGHLVDRAHRLEEFFLVDVTRLSLEKDVDMFLTNSCLGNVRETWQTDSARGAAILRMLSSSLGEDQFWENVRKQILNMKPDSDLLTSLLSSSPEWLSRSGYPVITVTRNYSAGTAQLEQTSFMGDDNATWSVPLEYMSSISSSKLEKFQMKNEPGSQTLTGLGRGSFHYVMVNPQGNGYYRVRYDAKNWSLLKRQVWDAGLSPVARSVILDDALSLARARLLPYSDALDLASYLRGERDALPWRAAVRQLEFLHAALRHAPDATLRLFMRFLEELVSGPLNALKEVEENGEDLTEDQKLLRNTILPWSCELGLPSCDDLGPLDKEPWLCTLVREKTSSALWQDFLAAEPCHRKLYVEALGCATSADVIQRFMTEAVEGGIEFTPEEVVSAVVNNAHAVKALVRVVNKRHRTTSWFPRVLHEISRSVSKQSDFSILRINLDVCGSSDGKTTSEPSNERLSWSSKFLDDVTHWLERRYPNIKSTS